jgi:WD repeat-containing protein 35
MERQADDISLDHLSRVLCDVHQDSSTIMNDLLSGYQISLLDMLFMGEMASRNKFNMIIADKIKPHQSADLYMDKGDFENELKQVIGDMHVCHDLGDDGDLIIVGNAGLLAVGPNVHHNEDMLVAYLGLLCREVFIRNYFVRMFIVDKNLAQIRMLIMHFQSDPNYITLIRDKLSVAARDIVLMEEILEYLEESLTEMSVPPVPDLQTSKRLARVLDIDTKLKDVRMRSLDLEKLSQGSKGTLQTLQGRLYI